MTYWEQECGDKSLQETLVKIVNNSDVLILEDEKELFRVLKRHLTRKELHAFCMKEGGKSDEEISERVSVEAKEVELLLRKANRKLKQAKVTNEIFIKNED
jgi:DNA-directed RNA polymerase specialized sigma24 family protein